MLGDEHRGRGGEVPTGVERACVTVDDRLLRCVVVLFLVLVLVVFFTTSIAGIGRILGHRILDGDVGFSDFVVFVLFAVGGNFFRAVTNLFLVDLLERRMFLVDNDALFVVVVAVLTRNGR